MEEIKIKWSLPEYEHREKSKDWFWALGIIIVAGSITSLIYGNVFFAMILIIGGTLMWYFAKKHPEVVPYELNEKGFMIKERLYPYDSIKSFYVSTEPNPTLFVRSSRPIMPIITVPTEEFLAEKIKSAMIIKKIPEEEMKEHISEHIMNAIGF